ncbi:Phenylacetic acid catabolic protein [Cycloclasticus sp.]|jgi:ring-1,2-phenylacetyl-CoA epoxidase subunit PaaC|uniref:Phenylacetic acid catabolic protein n=1 Tax=Cycloclasticus sp. TaxID=2024830 RepID=UPI000C0C90DE|nr:Phenylacetic acid catabolic protein [Cycloclasticus sp.]PHR51563.1 MAG: hypothetical protein COA48_00370 [Cycloclasticus sp.]|tara:strand:- start:1047 stop:1820 length:774 start_codon:yes stop_codon:yes gene_type:complete
MNDFSLESLEPNVLETLKNELLAVADTKLVLGNWYVECTHNGRSVPDFAGLLGMATTTYGQVRSLYLYLMNFGCKYETLERGRQADEISSMDLLDSPPESWEDFIATSFLAEQATWMMLSGFLDHPDRALSGLANKIGQEIYFHLKFYKGWMDIFVESGNTAFLDYLNARYPIALRWFGNQLNQDLLSENGLRNVPLADIKNAFTAEVTKVYEAFDANSLSDDVDYAAGWNETKRRTGNLPDSLYEIIRFKDPSGAH